MDWASVCVCFSRVFFVFLFLLLSPPLQARDLKRVGVKLKCVLVPSQNQEDTLKQLAQWDLWGPLLLCLCLSMYVSLLLLSVCQLDNT